VAARLRGVGLAGERYVGSARLSHHLPDGPELVSPLKGDPPQNPDDTTVVWKAVAPPKEVLAIEEGGNQTLSADTFTTAP
jgi:hypothetical protein